MRREPDAAFRQRQTEGVAHRPAHPRIYCWIRRPCAFIESGKDHNIGVMGDNLGYDTMVDGARRLQDLGCGYIVHHIGYDERRGIAARGERMPSPMDDLDAVVKAVDIPVQAVGGLSLEQAIECPAHGAPLVVLGAPLTIDADAFKTADGNLEESLRMICERVHAYGEVNTGKERA